MPGTILVSVLDLVDLPSSSCSIAEGSDSEAPCLKVAMGKREYKTNGRGDFSFPLLSLRENLVIVLHDADGNEISRTDVKAMQVVEKEVWDAWFPLEGGGTAHLKLQFSITEGDQKRVHKMRESALKRKHANLLISGSTHSAPSEETGGGSTPKAASKFIRLGLLDQLQQTASVKDSFQQASQKILVVPDHKEPQVRAEKPSYKDTFSPQLPLTDIYRIGDTIGKGLHTKQELTRSSVTETLDVAWLSTSPKTREDGEQTLGKKFDLDDSPASKVKKMISAFEGSFSQERKEPMTQNGSKTRSQLKSIWRTSSFKGALFADSEKTQSGEVMTKSFSVGMLSDMNLEQFPNDMKLLEFKERKESTSSSLSKVFHTHSKSTGSEENQELTGEMIPEINVKKVHADETMRKSFTAPMLSNIQLGQSKEYLKLLDGKEQEEYNGAVINKETINTTNKVIESEENQTFKDFHSQELKAIEDYNFLQDAKSTKCDNKNNASERVELPEVLISVEPKENVESCSLLTREQQSVLDIVEESVCRSSRDVTSESSVCGTYTQFLEFVTEPYLLGYPDIWIKRRICITTGTKELIDIIGGFDISVGTCSRSNPIKLNAYKEHMEHGDPCIEVTKDETNSCSSRKSETEGSILVSKTEGKLIGQMIRITILVVACGALMLKSR